MTKQSTRVLHGEGKPRIVIPEDEITASGIISAVNDINIDGSAAAIFSSIDNLSNAILNRQLIATNKYGSETKGKVIKYFTSNKMVMVKEWDNEPAIPGNATIKNQVIDLPFTEELYEWFDILFGEPFVKFHNKEKVRDIEGFYYNCSLNYERYMVNDTLASMQNIYSAKRKKKFWFMPRVDNMRIFYKCELAEDTVLAFAQNKYYQGHKYVKFDFGGVELLEEPNLISTKDNKVALADESGTLVTDVDGTGIN